MSTSVLLSVSELSDNNIKEKSNKILKLLAVVMCIGITVIICYYDIYQTLQIQDYVSGTNTTCGEPNLNDSKMIAKLFVIKSVFDLLFFLFGIVNMVIFFVILPEYFQTNSALLLWFFSSIGYVLYNVISYSMVRGINACDYFNTYQKYVSYMYWYNVSNIACCIYGGILAMIVLYSAIKSKPSQYEPLKSKNDI